MEKPWANEKKVWITKGWIKIVEYKISDTNQSSSYKEIIPD